ncbi:MAG TPA: hypothetical protein VIV60_05130 [Polyangiaceae bacterium]
MTSLTDVGHVDQSTLVGVPTALLGLGSERDGTGGEAAGTT